MRHIILTMLLALSTSLAWAWEPSKDTTITIVSGFPAGGTTHMVAVWFEQYMTSKGLTVIVDVKPGAKGQIAAAHFSRQPSDGSTVMMALGLGMMVHADSSGTKKPDMSDFEPVTILGKVPTFLVTKSSNPVKTMEQFLANPNRKISIGYGTETQEIFAKSMAKQLGPDVVVVPYKSTGDVMRELLGGTIDYAISTQTSSGPFIEQGKLIALGTTASGTSVPEFSPEMNKLGKNFGAIVGVVLPKYTPKPIVEYYTNLTKGFMVAYKDKLDSVQMVLPESQFGPKEFLKDMKSLEATVKQLQ